MYTQFISYFHSLIFNSGAGEEGGGEGGETPMDGVTEAADQLEKQKLSDGEEEEGGGE